jgi:hypothetical protein
MAYSIVNLQTQFPLASLTSPAQSSLQNTNSDQPILLAQQSLGQEALKQDAKQINQNIENRYGEMLEHADKTSSGELQKTRLLESDKLLKDLDPTLTTNQQKPDVKALEGLKDLKGTDGLKTITQAESNSLLAPFVNLSLPWKVTAGAALVIGVVGCSIPVVKGVRRQLEKVEDLQKAFDEGTGKKLQAYLAKEPAELAWWDLPRWKHKSACQHLISSFYKPPVPEGMAFVHHREWEQIEPLAKQVISIDREKFTSKEFITYLKVRMHLLQGEGQEMHALQRSAKLLRAALAAKRYFEQIWQVEMRYLSSKQQEIYRFVDELLSQKIYNDAFRQQLQEKVEKTLPDVKSEEGKKALQSYLTALSGLSEYEFGLELLQLFKQYQLADYVVLRTVDELLNKLKRVDLTDERVVKPDIMVHFDAFEQLAPIIQMPRNKIDPESFTALVHFMVLEVKHQSSYGEFKQLTTVLEKWVKPFQRLIEIRADYDPKNYRLPQEFYLPVPGQAVYQKYEALITA